MSIAIILLCILIFLIYRHIRQRIEDRRNEELNNDTRKVCKKAERSIAVKVDNTLSISKEDGIHYTYVGKLEDFQGKLFDGCLVEIDGSCYCYIDGKLEKVVY